MINSVRNTVLAILNKHNYGYISPNDFNLLAKQAQLDIFVGIIDEINQTINRENLGKSGTGYADKGVEKQFNFDDFLEEGVVLTHVVGNQFSAPSLATTGHEPYLITKIHCYTLAPKTYLNEAEKISNQYIKALSASLLSAPSLKFPAYTANGDTIKLFPESINEEGMVECDYIRFPKDPKWTYVSLSSGEPIFNQSSADYQDFEISKEYENMLVVKILGYVGIEVREQTVYQFAKTEEVTMQQNKD